MGAEGAAGGSASDATAERLVDALEDLGPVESKKMFGGHGLFCEAVMFGLVDPHGVAFLRAESDTQRPAELDSHKHGRMPYWSVPVAVLDDHDELVRRATEALLVARANKLDKKR